MALTTNIRCWVALCLLVSLIAGQPLTPGDEARIDDVIKRAMHCYGYPGLMVSMVRGGHAVFTQGYGLAEDNGSPARNVPATESTQFPLMSSSKHFVATLIGHMFHNTNYTWDTPIHEVLANTAAGAVHFIDRYRSRMITLRDLLAHRSGIPPHDVIFAANVFTREQLAQRVRFLRATGPIRVNWDYNNLMYNIAVHVLEAYTGQTLDDMMQTHLFDKLGMTNTSTFGQGYNSNFTGWAGPHITLANATIVGPDQLNMLRINFLGSGAGPVATSAVDMATWMNFQLHHHGNVVDPAILDDTRGSSIITRRLINRRDTKPSKSFYCGTSTYGMGWHVGWSRGNPMVDHSGSMFVYQSNVAMLPYADIGVALAVNSNAGGLSRLKQFALDILLGVEPLVNESTICKDATSNRQLDDEPSSNYDAHDGQYGFLYGLQTIAKSKLKCTSNKSLKKKNCQGLQDILLEAGFTEKKPRGKVTKRQIQRPLQAYTGTFGNFAYGNLSIDIYPDDDEDLFGGDLLLSYGWLEMTLDRDDTEPDSFDMTILGLVQPFGRQVQFYSTGEDGSIDQMDVTFETKDSAYRFTRDLKFSEAPPPDIGHCPTARPCNET